MKTRILVCLFAALALMPVRASAESVIYLIRHAEVADDGTRNPPLNEVGFARADWYADYFADKGVTAIWSTNLNRTLQTIAPLSEATGLEVETYDPTALGEFGASLREQPGVIVVAGHSNTTPALVNAITGRDIFLQLQHFQFDFIFRVVIDDDGEAHTTIEYAEPRSIYGDHPSEP